MSASERPDELKEVGIDQRLNSSVPLDLVFQDETGRSVRLGDYFGRKPVILAPVYYECPMLCTQILNGLVGALKAVSFNPGDDFVVVPFSFDPAETPDLAAAKKAAYLKRYGRQGTDQGWHFLTGNQASITALTQALGFHYKYNPETKQFSHASGVMMLTPYGRLSRYFYGIEYAPRDLKFGLMEASQNKIGNPVDALLLFCYHYDPATGKYGLLVVNLVRVVGGVTVLLLVGFIVVMRRREWLASRQSLGGAV